MNKAASIPDRCNPFEWRGGLQHRLAKPSKIASEQHHAVLDWRQVPSFMARLRAMEGPAARMLGICILCAVRTGPVLKMKWREVDLMDATWSVPERHEKTYQPLRVPLHRGAVDILEQQRPSNTRPDDLVWHAAAVAPGKRQRAIVRVRMEEWLCQGLSQRVSRNRERSDQIA